MKIIIIGDTHGIWNHIYNLISKESPTMIISVGDFGWWPSIKHTGKLKSSVEIRWCDGNHEDFNDIQKRIENNELEVKPNIFYQPRGSVITLEDGRRILFMGGAESFDIKLRTPGIDWFPEETIKQKDIENLPETNIDIVISHTCPESFVGNLGIQNLDKDSSRIALDIVLEKYQPSLWYFGHFHRYLTGYQNSCRWTCLNMSNDAGWYEVLPD